MEKKPLIILRFSVMILALLLIGYWAYVQIIDPAPFYTQPDPEMAYFIDSLNVFRGRLYGFYQHPGTPVDIVGTLALGVTYPFIQGPVDHFIAFHLHNPHIFLGIVRTLLFIFTIFTMIEFSKLFLPVKHWTDALVISTLSVLFFAIFPRGFTQIMTWSHNSVSYPLGTLIVLWTYKWLRSDQPLSTKRIIILGAAAGVLTAIQLYFVTWVIGAAVTIMIYSILRGEDWKNILREIFLIGISSIIGFVIVTLPILQLYPTLLDWVIGILTHQGHYGGGLPGFMSLQLISSSFNQLFSELPLLLITAGLAIIILAILFITQRRDIKEKPGIWAFGLGLSIQILMTFLLILKHPNALYLQSVAALLPVLIAVLLVILQYLKPESSTQRLLKFSLSIFILVGFVFNLYRAGVVYHIAKRQILAATEDMDTFFKEYSEENEIEDQSLRLIYTYGVPSRCFSLRYGSSFTENGLSEEIDKICPNQYKLDIWADRVYLSDGRLVPPDDLDWDIIITMEAALVEIPDLMNYGDVEFSDIWLPSFGKMVYIVSE